MQLWKCLCESLDLVIYFRFSNTNTRKVIFFYFSCTKKWRQFALFIRKKEASVFFSLQTLISQLFFLTALPYKAKAFSFSTFFLKKTSFSKKQSRRQTSKKLSKNHLLFLLELACAKKRKLISIKKVFCLNKSWLPVQMCFKPRQTDNDRKRRRQVEKIEELWSEVKSIDRKRG